MKKAIDEGKNANVGLNAASQSIDKTVEKVDKFCAEDLKPHMSEIINDSRIERETRDHLSRLWTTYKDMKELFDHPGGVGGRQYTDFKNKVQKLHDDYQAHGEPLNLIFGGVEMD